MKFDKPRVFETTEGMNCRLRLTFESPADKPHSVYVCECCKGDLGLPWSLENVAQGGYVEVAPPFDISTLDCVGVFEPRPMIEQRRYFYEPLFYSLCTTINGDDAAPGWIEFPRPDIANETIAELRRRVNELQGSHDWYVQENHGLNSQVNGQRSNIEKLQAKATELEQRNKNLADNLRSVLNHIGHNTCHHENTKRGGSIWTICEDCGREWADDRGGFKTYKEPKWLTKAIESIGDDVPSTDLQREVGA